MANFDPNQNINEMTKKAKKPKTVKVIYIHRSDSKDVLDLNSTTIPKNVQKSLRTIKNAIKRQKDFESGTESLTAFDLLHSFAPYMYFLFLFLDKYNLKGVHYYKTFICVLLLCLEYPEGVPTAAICTRLTLTSQRHTQIILLNLYKKNLLDRIFKNNSYYYFVSVEVIEEIVYNINKLKSAK